MNSDTQRLEEARSALSAAKQALQSAAASADNFLPDHP